MSIKIEKTENKNELKLEFTLEAEKLESGMKNIYMKNSKYFRIAGFRPGKAPYNLVEKQYGKEVFYEDAFNDLVPAIYEQELKDNNIEAVSAPTIDIIQLEKGKEIIFTAIIQIKPEFKLGKYKGIELKKVEYNVSDEDIKADLESIAKKNSRLVNVENRAVEDKDTAIIDFKGFVDGVAFEGGEAQNHSLEIGSKSFIEGFEEQVIGMKIDEERQVAVKFPDEYFSKDLASKNAEFTVKLNEIKKQEIPVIDDELAKDFTEFDTLKDLENSIKEKLEEQNKTKSKHEFEENAIKTVSDAVEVEIPVAMIETEIDNMCKEVESRLQYQGLDLKQYLQMIGKTNTEFRKEYAEQANVAVKTKLVLEKIYEDAKLEIEDEFFNTKLEEISKLYGKTVEELKENEVFSEYFKNNLKSEKAIEYIIANAKII